MNTKRFTFKQLKTSISKIIGTFAIVVFIGVSSLKAQYIKLFNEQGFVANGTVLTFSDTFHVPEIVAHIWVHNSDNRSHDVRCKKRINDTIVGSLNYFCWGQCLGAGQYVAGPVTILGNDTNKYDFSGDYYPNGHVGISSITYVFYDDANNSDSAWFTAHFNAFDPNNIGDKNNKFSKGLISLRNNIVNDNINLRINEVVDLTDVSLRIIDITGKINQEVILKSGLKELNIDVSQLKSGFYLISVVQNQQKIQILKFIKQ